MSYLPELTVEVDVGAGWTTVSNVQAVQFDKGRIKISDEFRPGTGTINGRRNDLLPAGIVIGTEVRVYISAQGEQGVYLYYRVADLTLNYGIISSLDTWTMTLEDAFAYLGRNTIDISWANGTNTAAAFTSVCTASNLGSFYSITGKSTMSAQTITNGNAQDIMQTIINTEQGALYADGTGMKFYARGWQATASNVNFTDTGSGSNPVRYDQVAFRSMADNYADQVIVFPRGSTEVVTGDGIYSYNLDSYSLNSGQATNLAQYVAGVFDVQNSTPSSVSMLLNEQTTLYPWMDALQAPANAQLTLRGTLYNSIIIGTSITGDPSSLRFTFNLASSEFYSFLTLNNTVYGTLDNNKLGY